MKGPSLQYDLRVLRVFQCDQCGRQVHTPGTTTSRTCNCSDPPRFMRPLERPKTTSPDVSAFISPPDPEELAEETEEVIDEPYVPYIPQLPPKRVQYPNRRKLSDEIEKFQPPEFGSGVEGSDAATEDAAGNAESLTGSPPRESDRPDGRRDRQRSDRGNSRPPRDGREREGRDRERGDRGRPRPANRSGDQRRENGGRDTDRGPGVSSAEAAEPNSTVKSGIGTSEVGDASANASADEARPTDSPRRGRRRGRGGRSDADDRATGDRTTADTPTGPSSDPAEQFGSGVDSEEISQRGFADESGDDENEGDVGGDAPGTEGTPGTGDGRGPRRRGRRRGRKRGRGPGTPPQGEAQS